MFGLGMTEILVILAIALIIIGPKKLPDMARTLGKAMGEFKRSAQDFKNSIDLESAVPDLSDIDDSESSSLKEAVKAAKKEAEETGDTDGTQKTEAADDDTADEQTSTPYSEAETQKPAPDSKSS